MKCKSESVTSVKFGSPTGASNATELSASGGRGLCPLNPQQGSAPWIPAGYIDDRGSSPQT